MLEEIGVLVPIFAAGLSHGYAALALLYLAFALALVARRPRHFLLAGGASDANDALLARLNAKRWPALTQIRATVMLQTGFCILAVDFHAFPRAAAKTLTFGCSVMDLGVGAVVLQGALSRRRAGRTADDGRVRAPPLDAAAVVWRALVRHAPLLLLGLGRLLAVRATAYHEVHSEYGLHWNFFFTLAAVAAATSACERIGARSLTLGGLALLCAHQAALLLGLSEYVMHAPRVGWLAANKEGVVSLPGYLGLSMLGSALGEAFRPRQSLSTWRAALGRLAALDGLLWLAWAAVASAVQPTSRRLCNLAYVLWVLAQVPPLNSLPPPPPLSAPNLARCPAPHLAAPASRHVGPATRRWRPPTSPPITADGARARASASHSAHGARLTALHPSRAQVLLTLGLCVLTSCVRPSPLPAVIEAVSNRPLSAFLVANVLTGAINLAIDTGAVGVPAALALLAAYMLTVCAATRASDARGLSPSGAVLWMWRSQARGRRTVPGSPRRVDDVAAREPDKQS